MTRFFLLVLMSLTTPSAFAAATFYQCEGFAGVEEYRARIDLKAKKAYFFDNDATSVLTLKSVKVMESLPPQTIMTFEGKDAGYNGTLSLSFNLTRRQATLTSMDRNGTRSDVGTADCEVAFPASSRAGEE